MEREQGQGTREGETPVQTREPFVVPFSQDDLSEVMRALGGPHDQRRMSINYGGAYDDDYVGDLDSADVARSGTRSLTNATDSGTTLLENATLSDDSDSENENEESLSAPSPALDTDRSPEAPSSPESETVTVAQGKRPAAPMALPPPLKRARPNPPLQQQHQQHQQQSPAQPVPLPLWTTVSAPTGAPSAARPVPYLVPLRPAPSRPNSSAPQHLATAPARTVASAAPHVAARRGRPPKNAAPAQRQAVSRCIPDVFFPGHVYHTPQVVALNPHDFNLDEPPITDTSTTSDFDALEGDTTVPIIQSYPRCLTLEQLMDTYNCVGCSSRFRCTTQNLIIGSTGNIVSRDALRVFNMASAVVKSYIDKRNRERRQQQQQQQRQSGSPLSGARSPSARDDDMTRGGECVRDRLDALPVNAQVTDHPQQQQQQQQYDRNALAALNAAMCGDTEGAEQLERILRGTLAPAVVDVLIREDKFVVEGFVCPNHGARHAYCARCILEGLDIDSLYGPDGRKLSDRDLAQHLPMVDMRDAPTVKALAQRWPARCLGTVRRWIGAPNPPIPVASGDAPPSSSAGMPPAHVLRCDFALPMRFLRALIERAPTDAISAALPNTIKHIESHNGALVEVRPRYETARTAVTGGRNTIRLPDDDEESFSSRAEEADAHNTRQLRAVRVAAFASVTRLSRADALRRSLARSPHAWVSACPECGHKTTMDRRRDIDIEPARWCPGCRGAYCAVCLDRLVVSPDVQQRCEQWLRGENAANRLILHTLPLEGGDRDDPHTPLHHRLAHLSWSSTPWLDNDREFLENYVDGRHSRKPAFIERLLTTKMPGATLPPGWDMSRLDPLDAAHRRGGADSVHVALAMRIAECLNRAYVRGSTQECPTCLRRVRLDERRGANGDPRSYTLCAPTDDSIVNAATFASALSPALAPAPESVQAGSVALSTVVDDCPCGTLWCYLCERATTVSRCQHEIAKRLGGAVAPGAPPGTIASLAPYDFATSVPARGSAPAGPHPSDAPWLHTTYWHESPDHGPWRHHSQWRTLGGHPGSAGFYNPLTARSTSRCCPPTMALLGVVCHPNDEYRNPLAGPPPHGSPDDQVVETATARSYDADRANLEIFHHQKRLGLMMDVIRHIAASAWVRGPTWNWIVERTSADVWWYASQALHRVDDPKPLAVLSAMPFVAPRHHNITLPRDLDGASMLLSSSSLSLSSPPQSLERQQYAPAAPAHGQNLSARAFDYADQQQQQHPQGRPDESADGACSAEREDAPTPQPTLLSTTSDGGFLGHMRERYSFGGFVDNLDGQLPTYLLGSYEHDGGVQGQLFDQYDDFDLMANQYVFSAVEYGDSAEDAQHQGVIMDTHQADEMSLDPNGFLTV